MSNIPIIGEGGPAVRLSGVSARLIGDFTSIKNHPTVAQFAGVGDGSVRDAVFAVCGALESAQREVATLTEDVVSLQDRIDELTLELHEAKK